LTEREGVAHGRSCIYITPYPWFAELYVLDTGSYRLVQSCGKTDTMKSVVFPGLTIELAKVFDFEIPPGDRIAMVKEGRPPYGNPAP
jgi:hypothetical protein